MKTHRVWMFLASCALTFCLACGGKPAIEQIDPPGAEPGQEVTISGLLFGSSQGSSTDGTGHCQVGSLTEELEIE